MPTHVAQSELPYDVTQSNYGDKGFAGYRVAAGVERHVSFGAGVYSFMRDHNVTVKSAIVCPAAVETSFVHALTVYLTGAGACTHHASRITDARITRVYVCVVCKVGPKSVA